jgi:hypothetical protein
MRRPGPLGWRASGRRRRIQQLIVTFDLDVNTGSASRPQSLGCAHSRALQPDVAPLPLELDEFASFAGISFPPFPTFPGSPSPGFCLGECGECGECFWRGSALGDEAAAKSRMTASFRVSAMAAPLRESSTARRSRDDTRRASLPVPGNDPKRYLVSYLAAQRDIEIWLAPVAERLNHAAGDKELMVS